MLIFVKTSDFFELFFKILTWTLIIKVTGLILFDEQAEMYYSPLSQQNHGGGVEKTKIARHREGETRVKPGWNQDETRMKPG